MKLKKHKEHKFICDCVAGKDCNFLSITGMGDKDALIDVYRKKKCLGGIYMKKGNLKKLIKLLIDINV